MIEILVGCGKTVDAERISERSVQTLDHPKLRSALSDAKARVGAALTSPREIPVNLSTENSETASIRVEIKTGELNQELVASLEDVAPGSLALPLDGLADGEYYAFFSADGFASQWAYFTTTNGVPKPGSLSVKLFRSRAVRLRWAFNTARGTALTGPGVEQGAAVLRHWQNLPHFGMDWQLWQKGTNGEMFGDSPFLEHHRISRGFGFAAAPVGTRFEDLTVAPTNAVYSNRPVQAELGLILFCRVEGHPPYGGGYGKILVEEVKMEPIDSARSSSPGRSPSPRK